MPLLASNILVVVAVAWAGTSNMSLPVAAVLGLALAAFEVVVCSSVLRRRAIEGPQAGGDYRLLTDRKSVV